MFYNETYWVHGACLDMFYDIEKTMQFSFNILTLNPYPSK